MFRWNDVIKYVDRTMNTNDEELVLIHLKQCDRMACSILAIFNIEKLPNSI